MFRQFADNGSNRGLDVCSDKFADNGFNGGPDECSDKFADNGANAVADVTPTKRDWVCIVMALVRRSTDFACHPA